MASASLSRPLSRLNGVLLLCVLAAGAAYGVRAEARQQSGPSTKQAALQNIATQVLLPGYVELAVRCEALSLAADELSRAPSDASLQRTRQAWTGVLLAWRRTQTFVHGPVSELNAVSRLQFWPLRTKSIDAVMNGSRPFTPDYIQELGAAAAGLFPIEIVLFDGKAGTPTALSRLTGPQGARQRAYVQAVARELARLSRLVERAWQGPRGYAASFASGGQDTLNLLLNDMLANIEAGAQERLRLVIDMQGTNLLDATVVEGGPSGSSQRGLLELVVSAERTFAGGSGPGLDDYLRRLNPGAAARTERQFRAAVDSVRAIGRPLDKTAADNVQAVTRARDECRALEVLLKVDVASALGVTLTFKATDGD